jgi:ectoine hydroxylase-related dioxygenase (phytanoyl-CoA dioxygenase family)
MYLNNRNYNTYLNDGVVKVNGILSNKEVSFLKKKINSYLKDNKNKLKGKNINYTNGCVNSVHSFKDKFFRKFSEQKKIIDLGNFFLKEKPKIKHFEYFAKPRKIGLESPMHQDNYYWKMKDSNCFTMWIAIDKATKKNGALEYLVGSHKKLYPHVASYAPGSSQKIKFLDKLKKKFKKKTFNLQPGDCLIHHSQIIHGSKKNESNISRRGFTIQIIPHDAKVDKEKIKKYKSSLMKQVKLREKLNYDSRK